MRVRRALIMSAASLLVAAACASTKKCPPPRPLGPKEICTQNIVWAKNPVNGACCQYATPCNAPKGWKTYSSKVECQHPAD